MRLEINYKGKNAGKLNNIFPNNKQVTEEIKRGIKFLEKMVEE